LCEKKTTPLAISSSSHWPIFRALGQHNENEKGEPMARKRYRAEEIIGHLRAIEMGTGRGLGQATRKLSITEQTFGMNC
jgi:hypothetical protein